MRLNAITTSAYLKWRKMWEARKTLLRPEEIALLRFSQFKVSTAAFFYARSGKTDIRVGDLPHFSFARSLADGNASTIQSAEREYRDYLNASWQPADAALIQARVDKLRSHFNFMKFGGFNKPPLITKLGDDLFLIDGNHRSSIAAALGISLTYRVLPFELAYRRKTRDEFYGTGNRGMPYQSIFFHGEEVVPGRRADTIARLRMIPAPLISQASILDVGCNIGMSTILAKRLGASRCLGIDLSYSLTNRATRFSIFEGVYPDVIFSRLDLDTEQLPESETFDIGFMFSVITHLKNPDALLQIARKNIRRAVIFEGHPDKSRERYASFFESGLFKRVEEIGKLPTNRFSARMSRTLWLCEK